MKPLTFTLFICAVFFSSLAQAQDGCIRFDGINDYLRVSSDPMQALDQQFFTIEAWIKGFEEDQTMHPPIFSNRAVSGDGTVFFLHNQWGGSLHKMLCLQMNSHNYLLIDNGTFNGSVLDGQCHHVAVVRESTILSFYIDGSFVGSRFVEEEYTTASSNNADMYIGYDIPTNNAFNGIISDVRLWNEVFNEATIAEHQNAPVDGTENFLLAAWPLNEGQGQLAHELVSQQNAIAGGEEAEQEQDPIWIVDCCSSFVAVEENNAESTLAIYPNPVIDLLQVTLNNQSSEQIRIFDASGRLIWNGSTIPSSTLTLDVSDWAHGLYTLVATEVDTHTTQKFMVQ